MQKWKQGVEKVIVMNDINNRFKTKE